jgi:hypothetical protein
MMKERAAGEQRDRLLAGVDQVVVLLAGRRCRPHAEHAVLAVQNDLAILRQVVRDQRRQADAEVDDGAVGYVLRDAARHLLAVPLLHHAASVRSALLDAPVRRHPGGIRAAIPAAQGPSFALITPPD